MMIEYIGVGVIIIISTIIASVIVGASYILGIKKADTEKVSVYECGFDPYGDSRQKFEVKFFLVGILFIIFDLEISFIIPWSIVLSEIYIIGYWTIIVFVGILTVGLIYEWIKGGLEWE